MGERSVRRFSSAWTDCPVQKDRPGRFALLPINNPPDAADIMLAVAKAVAAGDITPKVAASCFGRVPCGKLSTVHPPPNRRVALT
jgi:hypothetical protein